MKYFSMFSGIGGFELGIQNASQHLWGLRGGNEALRHQSDAQNASGGWTSPTCVGYSEIDKYAIKVYERQFGQYAKDSSNQYERPDIHEGYSGNAESRSKQELSTFNRGHRNYGDATKIDTRQLPDFDLLVGGFPCQSFSIAGRRAGFDDTRGTLFFDIARILKDKKPSHLVLENVKGLLTHDGGRTYKTILGVLADLGYRVEWQVLNSKDFGVPQNRERVYIVGHLRGGCGSQVFPLGSGDEKAAFGTLHANYHKGQHTGSYIEEAVSPTLRASDHKRGDNQTVVALTETRTDEAKAIRRESQKDGRDFSPRRGKVLKPRADDIGNTVTANLGKEHLLGVKYDRKNGVGEEVKQSHTLQAGDYRGLNRNQSQTAIIDSGIKIRRLTPKECERLQGFPDNWTQFGLGEEPISDTQRYKMCGNAVTTNTVQAVMERLLPCLEVQHGRN